MRITKALVLVSFLAAAVDVAAQSPRGKAEATVKGKRISIDYGRPSLKGRDMLSKAPAGTVWRMGADAATTIQTEGDLVFKGATIPNGSYSLYAKRVDEKTWHLVFNKQTGQWGTEHDASQDLAEVPLQWDKKDDSTEEFTIELTPAGELKMSWGKHVLKTTFQVK